MWFLHRYIGLLGTQYDSELAYESFQSELLLYDYVNVHIQEEIA